MYRNRLLQDDYLILFENAGINLHDVRVESNQDRRAKLKDPAFLLDEKLSGKSMETLLTQESWIVGSKSVSE